MMSLASNARAHSNTALTSACNAALRALKQGPHSGVLLLTGEDESGAIDEEESDGSPQPHKPKAYVNRWACCA